MDTWGPIAKFVESMARCRECNWHMPGARQNTTAPWLGGKPHVSKDGAWEAVAPSALPFDEGILLLS